MEIDRSLPRDDRGDTTILAVGMVLILFIAIGLVVDGSGLMRARDDARVAAENAARAATQQINEVGTLDGVTTQVDPEQARRTALQAATARGCDADVDVVDGQLVVTTRGEYNTTFWRIIGIKNVSVQGQAQVRPAENAS